MKPQLRRAIAGFSLLEALCVSLLASVLSMSCVSFLQVQIKTGVSMHQREQFNQQFGRTFHRLHRSLERLRLPAEPGQVQFNGQGLTIDYLAGKQTRNCHNTKVLPDSKVRERYFQEGHVLSCWSRYLDINGQQKVDRQPLLNAVHQFQAQLIHGAPDCIDTVDITIALQTSLIAGEQSFKMLYPKCPVVIEKVGLL